MMEEKKRQLEEIKDIKEQQENDERMSNYRVEAFENGRRELERREKTHAAQLSKVDDDLVAALAQIQKEKENLEKEHEEKQKQLLESQQKVIEQKTENYSVVTMEALSKINEQRRVIAKETDQLERERIEAEEKQRTIKIQLAKARFDEAQVKREKQEKNNEKMEEQLIKMQLDNQEQLIKNEENSRCHMKENNSALISQIRDDAARQLDIGLVTVEINDHANDRKNRYNINQRFQEVKDRAGRLHFHYEEVIGTLTLTQEEFGSLKANKLRRTIDSLNQFSETLQEIQKKLDDIDQLLAGLELRDVDKAQEIRTIKEKIFEFPDVIAFLKIKLEIKAKEIDVEKIKEFTSLKNALGAMINAIILIPETRKDLQTAIRSLPGTSSQKSAQMAIQN